MQLNLLWFSIYHTALTDFVNSQRNKRCQGAPGTSGDQQLLNSAVLEMCGLSVKNKTIGGSQNVFRPAGDEPPALQALRLKCPVILSSPSLAFHTDAPQYMSSLK
jgi:CO/xanthine dehydrogenase FAD-binding subunit